MNDRTLQIDRPPPGDMPAEVYLRPVSAAPPRPDGLRWQIVAGEEAWTPGEGAETSASVVCWLLRHGYTAIAGTDPAVFRRRT